MKWPGMLRSSRLEVRITEFGLTKGVQDKTQILFP